MNKQGLKHENKNTKAMSKEDRTPKEILELSIWAYNKTVNNISKFKLNERETKMFTDCMQQYADQEVKKAVLKALKEPERIIMGLADIQMEVEPDRVAPEFDIVIRDAVKYFNNKT